jgi:SAM-dependent methyltransferase
MPEDKSVLLGRPSFVWRFGQDRRLNLIRQYVPLAGTRVLDIGCGIGAYLEKFEALDATAFGVDIDLERLGEAYHEKGLTNVALSFSEALPFLSNSFDAVLLHEVIEHVIDDRETICEAHRVTRPGGLIVVFAPNRYYPFETHGAYFGDRYVFGNIPLVGYMPDNLRRRFAPHVRAYRVDDILALFAGLSGELITHTQIYPGYDKIARRQPALARLFRGITYALENTPLRALGLSHFLVWKKT